MENQSNSDNTENISSPQSDPNSFEKFKIRIELLKWFIVSVVLVVMTAIIDWGFRDRAAGIQEIQQYDKYATELIVLNNDPVKKRMLAQFFANVTPSDKLRDGWKNYYDEVNKDYHKFLFDDSVQTAKLEALKRKDSLTTSEKTLKADLQKKVFENKIIKTDPIILPSSDIKLVSATVTFLTHRGNDADDKDYNTTVFVDLVNSSDQNFATLNCCGNVKFEDSNFEYGPLSLDINQSASILKDALKHGVIKIHIEPVGNDTWHFSTILWLTYSDGTKSQLGWTNPVTVSQDQKSINIPF